LPDQARAFFLGIFLGKPEWGSWILDRLPAPAARSATSWCAVFRGAPGRVVAHEVHDAESAELAALLMRRASLAEELAGHPLVLHSDNGSPMKGATMLATL
jgi:hypothetical protein